jgi:osmotically-inducible protein OsmY
MKACMSLMIGLVALLLCSPAFAGRIVRSNSGTRESITLVDHGGTRGRAAIRVGSHSKRTATATAVRAKRGGAANADERLAEREAVAAAAPSYDIDAMGTDVVTSVLRLRMLAGDTEVPDVATDPTAYELRLLGAANNEATRNALADQAMMMAGVASVRNEVSVLSDRAPSVLLVYDDAHVQQRVERALLSWPALHSADIQVSVRQGITTLTGSVATQNDRELASTAAASAPGVYLVQNRLGLLAH